MRLTPRIWKDLLDGDHIVNEVSFDVTDIQAACRIADAKVEYTDAHNPGGILRSSAVIRNRLIAGKLADAAVMKLISQAVSSSQLEAVFAVSEYDSLRNDDFKKPDPYDLELRKIGTSDIETVEIRSSFSYKLAPKENIVKKLSIYGWYTSANKRIEEPRKWYWQVIYYLRPRDISNDSKLSVGVFEDGIEAGNITGYIVGGASRDLLKASGIIRKDQDGASYQSLFPICTGMDCQEMLTAMLSTQ